MTASSVIEQAGRAGIRLWREGNRLRYAGKRDAVAALLPSLKAHKAALLEALAGPSLRDALADWAERAAILEFDGGLSRSEAERNAWRLVVQKGGARLH